MATPVIVLLGSLSLCIGLLDLILQTGECLLLICVLAPLLSTHRSLARWQVDCTDARLDLIDILPALATATEGVKGNLTGIKLLYFGSCADTKVNEPVFSSCAPADKGYGRSIGSNR